MPPLFFYNLYGLRLILTLGFHLSLTLAASLRGRNVGLTLPPCLDICIHHTDIRFRCVFYSRYFNKKLCHCIYFVNSPLRGRKQNACYFCVLVISPAQARIVHHERFKFKRYMWTGENDLKSFDENIHVFSKFHKYL